VRPVFGSRQFLWLLFAIFALIPAFANPYVLFVSNMGLLYILLAVGLNLLIGYAGQFALGNAAMFGIGAYGTGLLQVKLGWPYFAAAPAGILIAVLVGSAIALPALRLAGIYLALTTLAFAEFTRWTFIQWTSVTYGAGGFASPPLDVSPLPVPPHLAIYYLSWIVSGALVMVALRIVRSRIGRAFVAIRDGEIAAQALGVNLLKYKVMAFALSAFFAGTAGALYAPLLGYVAPEGFDLLQMVIHKIMVVVGGIGSVVGSVIGAVLMLGILEGLREFKATLEIVFGTLLIAFVLFRPHGLISVFRRLPGWDEPVSSFDPKKLVTGQAGPATIFVVDRPAEPVAEEP
jgi:branched-chain amino acid transport system permease protein